MSRELQAAKKAVKDLEEAGKEHGESLKKAGPVLEALGKGDITAALDAWDPEWAKKHDFVELTAKLAGKYGDPNAPVTVGELEKREAARKAAEDKAREDAKKTDEQKEADAKKAKEAATAAKKQAYMTEAGKAFEAVPAAERQAKWPAVFEFEKREGVDLFSPDRIDEVVRQHHQQTGELIAPAAALDAIEAYYASRYPELVRKPEPAPAAPPPTTVTSRWTQGAPAVGGPPPEQPKRKRWEEAWDEDIAAARARDRAARAS